MKVVLNTTRAFLGAELGFTEIEDGTSSAASTDTIKSSRSTVEQTESLCLLKNEENGHLKLPCDVSGPRNPKISGW
jgi:hypothetical protein